MDDSTKAEAEVLSFSTILNANGMQLVNRPPPLKLQQLNWGNVPREVMVNLLQNDGDFLLRQAEEEKEKARALSVNVNNTIYHFKLTDKVSHPSSTEKLTWDQVVRYHYELKQPMDVHDMKVKLENPVYKYCEPIEPSRITFLEKFRGKLQIGTTNEVWKAIIQPGNVSVAVKLLKADVTNKKRDDSLAEAKYLSVMLHENVVAVKGLCFWTQPPPKGSQMPKSPMMLIMSEFCNYGLLLTLLEKDLVEDRGMVRSLWDASKGMEYLHKNEFVHRYLSCRKLIVAKTATKFIVKILDFSLARLCPNMQSMPAARLSHPPEVLKGGKWTTTSDVYTFGIVMQEVYNKGVNPYEAHFDTVKSPDQESIKSLAAGFRLPLPKGMPESMARLTQRCMNAASQQRPTMTAIAEELKRINDEMSGV